MPTWTETKVSELTREDSVTCIMRPRGEVFLVLRGRCSNIVAGEGGPSFLFSQKVHHKEEEQKGTLDSFFQKDDIII